MANIAMGSGFYNQAQICSKQYCEPHSVASNLSWSIKHLSLEWYRKSLTANQLIGNKWSFLCSVGLENSEEERETILPKANKAALDFIDSIGELLTLY